MDKPILLNPAGQILPEIASGLRDARKTKAIWAKQLERACQVETLEGVVQAEAGDYLCRGIELEYWPQKEKSLLEKYLASNHFDQEGWQRFDPKLDLQPVQAVSIDHPFRVLARWGELTGKANDYLVQSKVDPEDVWIVDKAIFEASYEYLISDRLPVLQKSEFKRNVAREHEANDTVSLSKLKGESKSHSEGLDRVARERQFFEQKDGSQ